MLSSRLSGWRLDDGTAVVGGTEVVIQPASGCWWQGIGTGKSTMVRRHRRTVAVGGGRVNFHPAAAVHAAANGLCASGTLRRAVAYHRRRRRLEVEQIGEALHKVGLIISRRRSRRSAVGPDLVRGEKQRLDSPD